jgi:hypothetical protein
MAIANNTTISIRRRFFDLSDEMLVDFDRMSLWRAFGASASCDWDELLRSPRVLMISEAGSGKTHECKAEQRRLWDAGEPAFYLELAELAKTDLDTLLTPEETERLAAWQVAQSDIVTFFLDSIDELQLTRGSFRTALIRLATMVSGQLHRIRVVVTARPVVFDRNLIHELLPVPQEPEPAASDEAFADIATDRTRPDPTEATRTKPPPDWRSVALMPLDDDQIRQFAQAQGVTDADALLAAIEHDNAVDFAQRPQDLIELCAAWRERGRIGSHREQVESNIAIKLQPRTDRAERTALSPDKARDGAARLALAALLTRKFTLRHSVEADRDGEPGTALNPQSILSDWNEEERRTLLERALFSFASYGRVRFHHRSVIEYLAAERLHALRQRGMSIRSIKRLLFADLAYGPRVIKPTLRPVAAWLALKDGMDSILDEVLAREPEVLLDHGDPRSLSVERRERVLGAYVERYGSGGWRGQHIPSLQVRRFAAPELGDEVLRLWAIGIENPEVRELLLDIAAAAPFPGVAEVAHRTLLDTAAELGERLSALDVLIRTDDPRLDAFTQSLADEPGRWPRRLVNGALLRLLTDHLAAERFCRILATLEGTESRFDLFDGTLCSSIERCTATPAYLDAARRGLTALVHDGVRWDQQQCIFVTAKPHLVALLAVLCRKLIASGKRSTDVLESSVLALRLTHQGHMDTAHADALRRALAACPPTVREATFWADDSFCQRLTPHTDPSRRLFLNAKEHGAIGLDAKLDAQWVLAALSDGERPEDQRALMLEAALRGIFDGPDDWTRRAEALRPHVADSPALLERIAQALTPPVIDPEHKRWQERWQREKQEREREEEDNHASWREFWTEIARDPATAFSADREESTIWNLWSVMARTGEDSHAAGWNRRFMVRNFGRATTDRMRVALTRFWRQERPTLRSERPADEKNTYTSGWVLGVAAIAAEAEDPGWARNLSIDEAELAARFALIELNGLPSWLDSLAAAHAESVEAVLGTELIHELDEPAAKGGHDAMLQHLRRASPGLVGLFIPRLHQWLDANAGRVREGDEIARVADRLRAVIDTLLSLDDTDLQRHVLDLARTALDSGCRSELEAVWLPVLMRLQPEEGVARLEALLRDVEPQPLGIGVEWIARLFGDRHNEVLVNPRDPGFTPNLLLRLVRLAYRQVRRCDNIHHDGVYHPGPRDHAESGRNALLNALLDRAGPDAWAAKLELAADPEHSDFRDRLLIVAREKAAEEIDRETLSDDEAAALDRQYEAPPTNPDDLFALLRDRLDDLEEMLRGDASPRKGWSQIQDECAMRQVIANELEHSANGLYSVPQEAATANENFTDIRLRVAGHDLEAVIELKIGERWSGRELRDTIKDQLVDKYLVPENRRVGCLLVTVASTRTWQHPESGAALDPVALQSLLEETAAAVADRMGHSVRLIARVLDLRPKTEP